MDYFLVAVIAFFCGWVARQVVAIIHLRELINNLEQEQAEEQEQERMISISIEKHNDEFLVYDNNSKFLVQGSNREEIETKLSNMFPGKRFACQKDNLKEVGFFR
jgi:flagellar biosynthesis/type III secretory pathway M-ring protein FliF/YscJ